MLIFYGRWQQDTDKGVRQTQILVQEECEGQLLVSTIEGGRCVTRPATSRPEAMTLVANICERLGGHE